MRERQSSYKDIMRGCLLECDNLLLHSISSFLWWVCGGMWRKRIVFLRRIGKHKAREHLLHLLSRCVLTSLACGSYVPWTKFEICTPDVPRCERNTAFSPPLPLPSKLNQRHSGDLQSTLVNCTVEEACSHPLYHYYTVTLNPKP